MACLRICRSQPSDRHPCHSFLTRRACRATRTQFPRVPPNRGAGRQRTFPMSKLFDCSAENCRCGGVRPPPSPPRCLDVLGRRSGSRYPVDNTVRIAFLTEPTHPPAWTSKPGCFCGSCRIEGTTFLRLCPPNAPLVGRMAGFHPVKSSPSAGRLRAVPRASSEPPSLPQRA